MDLRIFDVAHGACALIESPNKGRIALIDCGHNATTGWTPADDIESRLGRNWVDYLLITNADQDHYSNLATVQQRIGVGTFIKNPSVPEDVFELIKRKSGPLSRDAEAYKSFLKSHTLPVSVPFNDGMGGIELRNFWNSYPTFGDLNNLSLVSFVSYGLFRILFPGDLERPGWLELLKNPAFREYVRDTTILVASHHGRQSGYCPELFEEWGPRAVVISDKGIVHATQETVPQYQNCLLGDGVNVVGQDRKRHVLTTRKDGCIHFRVAENGGYTIYTY
jgi:beta-lactamase superfamily II metal-dependent hydrolase